MERLACLASGGAMAGCHQSPQGPPTITTHAWGGGSWGPAITIPYHSYGRRVRVDLGRRGGIMAAGCHNSSIKLRLWGDANTQQMLWFTAAHTYSRERARSVRYVLMVVSTRYNYYALISIQVPNQNVQNENHKNVTIT